MGRKKAKTHIEAPRDAVGVIIIIVVSILSRLPFITTFQFVTFDGTFYLNQARTLFSGPNMMGAFPVGYPAAVAFFHILVPDVVVAGRIVSFLASVGSGVVLYLLAKRYVRREYALLCALLLVLNPLFIRFSLVTMSESLYVFWVLLGLLLLVKKKHLLFGLVMGAAAITRPEALAIAGILMLTLWKKPKYIAIIVGGLAVVYSLNVVALSQVHGRLVVIPKTENIGASVKARELGEATFDFEEKVQLERKIEDRGEEKSVFAEYAQRFPRELLLVARHTLPIILLLSVLGFRRRKMRVFLAALAFFFVFPVVTPRSEPRFILPYIPILIFGGVVGLESIRDKRLRSAVSALVVLSAVALPFVNRDTLSVTDSTLTRVRDLGVHWSDRIDPGDRIADRKPFFAFYAGGEYVEIPLAPYDRTLQYLCDTNVKYLFLRAGTIESFRPALLPLLFDKAVVAGEMRFQQVFTNPHGEMIYERVRETEPLKWGKVPGCADNNFSPAWSPDGEKLAFRYVDSTGEGGICVTSPGQTSATKLMDESTSGDQLSWSPDGRFIAFTSAAPGNEDIFNLEIGTGKVVRMVAGEGDDRHPSWSRDGRFIAFTSNRTGRDEIWVNAVRTSEERRITDDGGNTNPAFSPSGRQIAWVKEGVGVVILDLQTGERVYPEVPKEVSYALAWSPDGSCLAVTGNNRGVWDIFLVRADGSEALVLTKKHTHQGMPSWRPDGRALAVNSEHGGKQTNWILTGLDPYLDRLNRPIDIRIFARD